MAEQTTTPTPIGKPISAFEELTEMQGTEIIPVVDGKNKKVSAETLKTFAQKGVVKAVKGKGLSSNDYTNEAKQKLDALPTNEKLTQDIADAKLALFIDQWNAACGSYGKYDPVNAPDPQHPFYLNELWMTYEEAVRVSELARISMPNNISLNSISAKTTLPLSIKCAYAFVNLDDILGFSDIKVVYLTKEKNAEIKVISADRAFNMCGSSEIWPILNMKDCKSASYFYAGVALKDIRLKALKISIHIASPLLSLASLQYMVANAANTTTITITVHPDVYAKLADETNVEWHKVMTDAGAKNINFATIE